MPSRRDRIFAKFCLFHRSSDFCPKFCPHSTVPSKMRHITLQQDFFSRRNKPSVAPIFVTDGSRTKPREEYGLVNLPLSHIVIAKGRFCLFHRTSGWKVTFLPSLTPDLLVKIPSNFALFIGPRANFGPNFAFCPSDLEPYFRGSFDFLLSFLSFPAVALVVVFNEQRATDTHSCPPTATHRRRDRRRRRAGLPLIRRRICRCIQSRQPVGNI